MKSYSDSLLKIAYGVLRDAISIYPQDHVDLHRDFDRISLLIEQRGISVFTLDLPALGKHFDKCLSTGSYTTSSLALSASINKSTPIPKLFRALLLRVFDYSGLLLQSPDINSIACLRQLYAFGKKVRIDCKEEIVDETISIFYQVDRSLPLPSHNWESSSTSFQLCDHPNRHSFFDYGMCTTPTHSEGGGMRDHQHRLLQVCQQVADILSATLGVFDPEQWNCKHGPGAVSDPRGSPYKYDFSNWSDKLEARFPSSLFAYANYDHWISSLGTQAELSSIEPSSKLVCVPKTQKGPRLIAAEPSEHQWCQQAIWNFLEIRCKSTWINGFVRFRDQTFNQEGARRASLTGDYWTVDLSAASDRLTCRYVERLFRMQPSLLDALRASRTTSITQKISGRHPELYKLIKFSTMGNACTFPVETLGFLVPALAALIIARDLPVTIKSLSSLKGEVRVFGDDIIIPSDAGPDLQWLLEYFSFEINEAKTHKTGFFRESCGLEAYRGYDVTPAYWLQPVVGRHPASVSSNVECSNNFHLKGWWHAADAIRSTVQLRNIVAVPIDAGCFGFKSFAVTGPTSRMRWNTKLQRTEFRTLKIVSSNPKTPAEGLGALVQYCTERPSPDIQWMSGHALRPCIKLRTGWEDFLVTFARK